MMLLKNHVVESQSKNHGNKLQVILTFLHVSEQTFEVVSTTGQESDLILQNILSFIHWNRLFSYDWFPW